MKKRNPVHRVSMETRINGQIALEWAKRSRASVHINRKKEASKKACRRTNDGSFFIEKVFRFFMYYLLRKKKGKILWKR